MATRTCFVIMPIGDQQQPGITQSELRSRYDDLIKEALLKADPNLDVKRADDIAMPGTISSDILTRIMHSDVVVADITYPNPNVFYEIGLRHACRSGTILIRDKTGPKIPFDLAHQRSIEYENTPSGLKELAENFRSYLDHSARNPTQPDNHFLELARLIHYEFPKYGEPEEPPETAAFMAILQSPEMMDILSRQQSGEPINEKELIAALGRNPETAEVIVRSLLKSNRLSTGNSQPKANRAKRRSQGNKNKR